MNITHQLPKIINKSRDEVDAAIREIQKSNLSEETRELMIGCIEFATWLPEAIREKDISIRNLQRLLFGETGGKKKKKKKKNQFQQEKLASTPTESNDPAANDSSVAADSADSSESGVSADAPPTPEQAQNTVRKGHGRLGQSAYLTALNISVSLETFRAGDACPGRCGGRLCVAKPGIVIRIAGNALATVSRYRLEKLRCGLCGLGVAASLPPNVPAQKYDSAFKAILAIQKYYVAVPFYRQEQVQRLLGFPLPDATQFELVEQVADAGYPVVRALEKTAANGEVVHNDDTQAKILSVIQENKAQPDKARTGMHTTGLIVKAEGHTIALYYTGTRHAGENLEAVLLNRHPDRSPIIQMCDASSMNIPKSLETILCNCLGHGFRKFRDLLDFFPAPCMTVMKALSAVFTFDEQTQEMTALARWRYHRQHSKPVMLELNRWLKAQLAEKQVEPNSSLGKAMRYLLKHWKALRRFLVVPGAPIDNNIVERALKIPIRIRKAAMFYKTRHGAAISNILTTLIQTTALANENPYDYLVALQDYKSLVFKDPEAWLPWRYRETLEKMCLRKAA
jgi:hypothetical protein